MITIIGILVIAFILDVTVNDGKGCTFVKNLFK